MRGQWRTYSLLVITLLLLNIQAFGQSLNKPLPDLPFAALDSNAIVFPGDSTCYERLFAKMDSVLFEGRGQLNILHMGGSHVQAGTLTRQLRNNLLALRPSLDAGRGLVFPFAAAHTNNPSSFYTNYTGLWEVTKNTQAHPARRIGLTGMGVTATDKKQTVMVTTISRSPKESDHVFSFNSVKVLGRTESGDRVPVVILDKKDTLQGLLSAEDSTWVFDLPGESDSVKIGTAGTSGAFTLRGILLDNQRPGVSVSGVGVNGASLVSYSRCADLEQDLKVLNPDLIILAIGINDASGPNFTKEQFTERYKMLISRIQSAVPDCSILFVTNNDSFKRSRKRGYYANTNGALAREAFMELGEYYNCGVWDLFTIMGGLGSMKSWEAEGLSQRDKIHFTERGYEVVGDLLYNALMDRYVEHLRRSR